MIYREFQDIRLSALGMGAMRLPVLDGDDAGIDEAQTFRMVDAAMAGAKSLLTEKIPAAAPVLRPPRGKAPGKRMPDHRG